MYIAKGLATLAAMLIAGSADALVMDYDIGKARVFEQTANDTAPTTPENYLFFSQLSSDNDTDFSAVDLVGSPGGSIAYNEQFGGFNWNLDEEFANEAALNAVYPDGDYTIEASTAIGVIREPVTLDGDFPTTIPYFTGAVAEALQSIDPSQSMTITWNTPDPTLKSALFVDNVDTQQEVFYLEPAAGVTSLIVPPNSLQHGTSYRLALAFFTEVEDEKESFSTGNGKVIKGNLTEIPFTIIAVPEPATTFLTSLAMLFVWFITGELARERSQDKPSQTFN